MRYYTYFPGCSLKSGAVAYDVSTRAVAKELDVELIELEDWNCCGATSYSSMAELSAYSLSARNLALAEQRGLDLVAPCSACYTVLRKTQVYLEQYPKLRRQVDEALAAGGLKYNGGVKVHHALELVLNSDGQKAVQSNIRKPLTGLKVAPYYGCQTVRPLADLDDPEYPTSMDKLLTDLGAEVVYFPMKSRCCGGSQMLSREKLALELLYKLLASAKENGAQCLATVCPACHTNLDLYLDKVNKAFNTSFDMPTLYITQLVGLAFGIDSKALMLEKNVVSPMQVLSRFV